MLVSFTEGPANPALLDVVVALWLRDQEHAQTLVLTYPYHIDTSSVVAFTMVSDQALFQLQRALLLTSQATNDHLSLSSSLSVSSLRRKAILCL